jgi:hypothetical protein
LGEFYSSIICAWFGFNMSNSYLQQMYCGKEAKRDHKFTRVVHCHVLWLAEISIIFTETAWINFNIVRICIWLFSTSSIKNERWLSPQNLGPYNNKCSTYKIQKKTFWSMGILLVNWCYNPQINNPIVSSVPRIILLKIQQDCSTTV